MNLILQCQAEDWKNHKAACHASGESKWKETAKKTLYVAVSCCGSKRLGHVLIIINACTTSIQAIPYNNVLFTLNTKIHIYIASDKTTVAYKNRYA